MTTVTTRRNGQDNPRKKHREGPRSELRFHNIEPHFQRMFELLSDGLPHVEDDIIALVSPLVPPTPAARRTLNQCKAQRRRAPTDPVIAIAKGQRRTIQQRLAGLERTGNATRSKGTITLTTEALVEYRAWAARQ